MNLHLLPGPAPLRTVVVGAGGMGMTWLRAVQAHPGFDLVGIADLDERRARGAAIRLRRPDLTVTGDLAGQLAQAPDVCVNITPPAAHFAVSSSALSAGLSVLSEKPFAATLEEAVALTRLAGERGRLLMIAQSRRYEPGLERLRDVARTLGPLGLVSVEFHRAYRDAGFRLAMDHPLLLDMAPHTFDAVRFVTGERPVAVSATEYNPPGSWYAGPAAAIVAVEYTNGVHLGYTGSWCSEGLETSWTGRWRVSGSHGSAAWDGETAPVAEIRADLPPAAAATTEPGQASADPAALVTAALDEFAAALRGGPPPWGEASDNLLTFATAQAAIESARRGVRVEVDELLARHGAELGPKAAR
ncbi:Gfo/Idh/MocA family oxidoreductase [Dactylosporangium sp. NPDC000244]|uniref:Gfo/Idh/MocA family protein n=1 Tax=Dactylosporangium sp. NPDC000244 TaxID=3154365 RepID=UPI00331CF494